MTEVIEANTLERYLVERGVSIISGTYKNEHSLLTFKCSSCGGIYQKTMSAFKRAKQCPCCPVKDVMLDKLIELIKIAEFEYISTFTHSKTQKFLIKRFNSEYVVNLQTLFSLLNLSVWDFYGLEPLEVFKKASRPDRTVWKCKYKDTILFTSRRRLTEKLQTFKSGRFYLSILGY